MPPQPEIANAWGVIPILKRVSLDNVELKGGENQRTIATRVESRLTNQYPEVID